jgi:putative transport protein
MVPIPLPGGITIKLGIAGGPLIVALLLGWRGRTGPILWTLPYSANLMLRQVGLVLFLAGVGTRAGFDFYNTITSGNGGWILLAAAIIVVIAALVTLWVGYRLLRISMGILTGILAGIQTQPATLAFALEQSGDELPNAGYASVYPMAMIAKIVLAQLILLWLGT